MPKSYRQMINEAKLARAPTVAEFIDLEAIEADSFQSEESRRLAQIEFDSLDHELHGGFGDYLEKRAELGDDSAAAMLSDMVAELSRLRRQFSFRYYHETLEDF